MLTTGEIVFYPCPEAELINNALTSADPLGELCKLEPSPGVSEAIMHALVGEVVALRKQVDEMAMGPSWKLESK
jgi:hypothetical protein